MESPVRFPASPGTPLQIVSPERANRQSILPSPSMASDMARLRDDPFTSSGPRSSDVQGKVQQFNNLSKELAQKRKDNEDALRRAVVGREEAESETMRLREERALLRTQIEEGKSREMKVARRLESVMEEMQRLKVTGAHSQTLFEKEVRRARKEAFKSSSALVGLQEELKTTRNRFTLMREDVDVQKRKVELKEKETFAAQYQLVGLQEELDTLRQKMKLVEGERDSLRTSLKEEEVARVAAEGRFALPPSVPGSEFGSPVKSRPSPRRSYGMNVYAREPEKDLQDEELDLIRRELILQKRWVQDADDRMEFMKMECQLKLCSCRRAEQAGAAHMHDVQSIDVAGTIQNSDSARPPPMEESVIIHEKEAETMIEFSPKTGTFRTIISPEKTSTAPPGIQQPVDSPSPATYVVPLAPISLSESPSMLSLGETHHRPSDDCMIIRAASPPITTRSPHVVSLQDTPPRLPVSHSPNTQEAPTLTVAPATPRPLPAIPPFQHKSSGSPRLVETTITTTIPLADPATPSAHSATSTKFPFSPRTTKTREEALLSIERWRKGRARSVTAQGTPGKSIVGQIKRDISAPASAPPGKTS